MDSEKDRRLGTRHVLGPIAVRWRLDDGLVAPVDQDRADAGAGAERAGLLDLSVSGCRIMARASDDIAVGDWTMVSIRGRSGPVVVRRILPSRQEGFSQYGLEFLDPLSELTQLVHEEIALRKARGAGILAPEASSD
ncbi:PilZ domain-containing protein [Iamia sp. SCSIO 61187]|uniref:PilZ domain-containing protein n=1 Tax=Iamia sp. SCSIO 61187 TaxID=2722752 RepID=UPI001C6293FE|nr:PilZ domain-containing protein [Iamia sp. SCSIO 61187]QYG94177.1 PilZ domain-containing protein [Iamia sp. SCSIO 61187]